MHWNPGGAQAAAAAAIFKLGEPFVGALMVNCWGNPVVRLGKYADPIEIKVVGVRTISTIIRWARGDGEVPLECVS